MFSVIFFLVRFIAALGCGRGAHHAAGAGAAELHRPRGWPGAEPLRAALGLAVLYRVGTSAHILQVGLCVCTAQTFVLLHVCGRCLTNAFMCLCLCNQRDSLKLFEVVIRGIFD